MELLAGVGALTRIIEPEPTRPDGWDLADAEAEGWSTADARAWLKSKREGEKAAVDAYMKALTLGGSRPLPGLFEAAGLKFEFGERPVAAVVEAVEGELATIGE